MRSQVSRVQPASSLSERLELRRALALVGAETVGLVIFLSLFAVVHAQQSVLAPLLVPPVVSFVLIVANPSDPGSRPARVVVSYLIAGAFGLGLSVTSWPPAPEAVVAGVLSLLLMHLTGAMHSPAIAVAIIAALAGFTPTDAAQALPLLMALAALVVGMAWFVHRVMADADYPQRLW